MVPRRSFELRAHTLALDAGITQPEGPASQPAFLGETQAFLDEAPKGRPFAACELLGPLENRVGNLYGCLHMGNHITGLAPVAGGRVVVGRHVVPVVGREPRPDSWETRPMPRPDALLALEEILATDRPVPSGEEIGRSREGRPIHGFRFGRGELVVSCIGGCHADEPVGPEMLDRLAAYLATLEPDHPLLGRFRWLLVPHLNPDGREHNRPWQDDRLSAGDGDAGFRLERYVVETVREPPGDDVEFGFPRGPEDHEARPENRAAAAFLASAGPLALHLSFHGMGFGHGPWFLLEPLWVERTRRLREDLSERTRRLGYPLHEVDRGGEKGFWRIARGFTTRPDSRAMRDYFLSRDDPETAARFRPSSMELARSLGGDPLTAVSEMPLFLLPDDGPLADPALPRLDRLDRIRAAVREHGGRAAEHLGIRPMPIRHQMHLQLALLDEALRTVARYGEAASDDVPGRQDPTTVSP